MPARAIVLIAIFVASLPVCFIRPFFGIVMWTIVAFLNPQSYLWGAANEFPWAMAVAVPTLIGLPMFGNGWKRLLSGKTLLLAILWIWFTITAVIAVSSPVFYHHAADTWARWQFVSKILLMTVATIALVDTFDRLRWLVRVTAGCFAFFVLKAIPFIAITGGAMRLYGPDRSMIADNNDFGLALNMTLPLFFFLAQTEEKPWVRRVFGVLFALTIPTIFFTYSRGAMVGVAVLMGVMLLRYKRRMLLIPVLAMGAIVGFLFAPDAWKERMDPTNAVDASARERFNAWTFSWNLAKDYPLTGGGFATFSPELFRHYAPVARDVRGPHSVYFGVLAEHGFPGLILYLTLVAACFLTTGRLVKWSNYYDDPVIGSYAYMFRFSLIAFLTSGFFLGRAYFDYYFTIVACIIALEAIAKQRWIESAEVQEADEETEGTESSYLPYAEVVHEAYR